MLIINQMIALSFIAMVLWTAPANADFIATGPIKAEACNSYVLIRSCKTHTIHAVKGDDGGMYTIATRYPSVSEYKESKGLCWIHLKSRGGGMWSMGINATISHDFYEKKPNGSFSKVDAEYLVFPCVKANAQ